MKNKTSPSNIFYVYVYLDTRTPGNYDSGNQMKLNKIRKILK